MYIHFHVVMYLYVHGINMSVPCSDTYVPYPPGQDRAKHCTHTFMIVNMCMYIVQTRLRLYSSTTTLHFSSGPISLATQASLSSVQAPFLQSCLLPSLSSVSCSIFAFLCTDIAVHSISMYRH